MEQKFALTRVLASLAPYSDANSAPGSQDAMAILEAALDWSSCRTFQERETPDKRVSSMLRYYYHAARRHIVGNLLNEPQKQVHAALSKDLGIRGRRAKYLRRLKEWEGENPAMAREEVLIRQGTFLTPSARVV